MPQEALEFDRRNSVFTMIETSEQKSQGEIAIHQAVFRYKETRIPGMLIRFEDSIEKMIESCNGNTKAELQLAIPQKEPYKSKRIAQYLACLYKEISDWVPPQILWAHSRTTDKNPRKFGNATPLPPYNVTLEFTHQYSRHSTT